MKTNQVVALLEDHQIQATPQRIAIADTVLRATSHPTADEVWAAVRRKHPTISRATVYNTLNLLAEKQLLKTHPLDEGATVFDPKVERHHHFIDEETGKIHDIPWAAITVSGEDTLHGFDVHDYQVVMRGKKIRR